MGIGEKEGSPAMAQEKGVQKRKKEGQTLGEGGGGLKVGEMGCQGPGKGNILALKGGSNPGGKRGVF